MKAPYTPIHYSPMTFACLHDDIIVIVLHVIVDNLLEAGMKHKTAAASNTDTSGSYRRCSQIGFLIEVENSLPEVVHLGQNKSMFNVIGSLHDTPRPLLE